MNASIPLGDGAELPATWSCRVRPFGVDIAVGCPTSLLPDLERLLSPWSHDTSVDASETHVRIDRCPDDGADAAYALHEGDVVIMARHPSPQFRARELDD